jgi:DICT domain-containing protein
VAANGVLNRDHRRVDVMPVMPSPPAPAVDATIADKRHLFAVCRAVESRTALLASGPEVTVMVCLQQAQFLTARTCRMYDRIAAAGCRVLLLGVGLADDPLPATGSDCRPHTRPLSAGDPLAREWDLLVAGPASSFALVSREIDGQVVTDDWNRRFWFHTSRDSRHAAMVVDLVRQRLAGVAAEAPSEVLGLPTR